MYLSHFNLKKKPFQISANPHFLWLGEKHREAFSILRYGILNSKGFLLLTGPVGAGKTTLINALVNSLEKDVICALLPDPSFDRLDFFRFVAHAFELDLTFDSKFDFFIGFREFLYTSHKNGKKVLLIIDESQLLSQSVLEEIRLLSNIEKNSVKLLNVFFVGQMEFNGTLLEEKNEALRQRITVTNIIKPLSLVECGKYVRHRLKIAGTEKRIFTSGAINEVYRFSRGRPRLINTICDIALIAGYARSVSVIDGDIVLDSAENLKISTIGKFENKIIASVEARTETVMDENSFTAPPQVVEPVLPKAVEADTRVRNVSPFSLVPIVAIVAIAVAYLFYSDGSVERFKQLFAGLVSEKVKNNYLGAVDGEGEQLIDASQAEDVTVTGEGAVSDKKEQPFTGVEQSGAKTAIAALIPMSGMAASRKEPLDVNQTKITKKAVNPFAGKKKLVVGFNYNSNDFSGNTLKILSELAVYMIEDHSIMVSVKGYTDSSGGYAYNVRLSSFRANIVKSFLVGKGVDISRIYAVGMGPENPIASNSTLTGRKANRRVEIEQM